MWMSSTMDGNKQKGMWLAMECKALKWVKTNSAPPPPRIPLTSPCGRWDDLWHHLHDYDDYKIKDTWMHRMHEQKGWIVWSPLTAWGLWNTTVLDIELKAFVTSNWRMTQLRWKFKVHLMLWIILSQPPLIVTLNWCGENCVAKASQNWRDKLRLVGQYNASPTTMGWKLMYAFAIFFNLIPGMTKFKVLVLCFPYG